MPFTVSASMRELPPAKPLSTGVRRCMPDLRDPEDLRRLNFLFDHPIDATSGLQRLGSLIHAHLNYQIAVAQQDPFGIPDVFDEPEYQHRAVFINLPAGLGVDSPQSREDALAFIEEFITTMALSIHQGVPGTEDAVGIEDTDEFDPVVRGRFTVRVLNYRNAQRAYYAIESWPEKS